MSPTAIKVEVRDGVAILPISDYRKAIGPKLDALLNHDAIEGVRVIRNGRPAYYVTAPEQSDGGGDFLTIGDDGVSGSVQDDAEESSGPDLEPDVEEEG